MDDASVIEESRRPTPLPAKEPPMLIIAAQIHLWKAGTPPSPGHRQTPAYLKEHALKEMDAGGVDAAILTPHTPWDPNANELCMEAARAHPDRFDPRQLPPRQAREPRAGRHVEEIGRAHV